MYGLYKEQTTISSSGYARTLYENYRARILLSSGVQLPMWKDASPTVKREFKEEARQQLR